jgi:hypothetical protein
VNIPLTHRINLRQYLKMVMTDRLVYGTPSMAGEIPLRDLTREEKRRYREIISADTEVEECPGRVGQVFALTTIGGGHLKVSCYMGYVYVHEII